MTTDRTDVAYRIVALLMQRTGIVRLCLSPDDFRRIIPLTRVDGFDGSVTLTIHGYDPTPQMPSADPGRGEVGDI